METAKYRRVLIKVSGEALAGDKHFGLDIPTVDAVAAQIARCVRAGVEVAVVTGGGNYWRGLKDGGPMERTRADNIGMLATVMNCLALSESLERCGIETRVQTAVEMREIADLYTRREADRELKAGRVVLLGCGTGNPFFSTDTGAVLHGTEIAADVIMLAKNIDGIYDSDPRKNPDAKKFDRMTYKEILDRGLTVIDSTAASLSMDNKTPLLLFALSDPENIYRACMGEQVGTLVTAE